MQELDMLWMSALIFAPAIFALVLMIPGLLRSDESMRWWTLLGTAVTFVISMIVFINYYDRVFKFHSAEPNLALLTSRVDRGHELAGSFSPPLSDDWVARHDWIPRFNIEYFLGVDGISLSLILLTTLLSFLAMIASWNIEKHVRGYCILFLILETGMIGTFLALDFFLFYIFWEVMLLPMYFLIGVWGGPRREYAAIKFFLYTLLGSVFILIAMLAFYFTDVRDFVPVHVVEDRAAQQNLRGNDVDKAVVNTFDLVTLHKVGRVAMAYLNNQPPAEIIEKYGNSLAKKDVAAAVKRLESQAFFSSKSFQITMFLLLLIGFAIKVPVFPFHTWLPDAHVEAPTPISMILAGVLLKLGGYGIIRIAYPICPWAAEELAYYVAAFGVLNIVYGAFAAMAQTDFKKLVAYSSISHMGYVILGIAVWSARREYWSWGMNGAMYQMIAHGITSAGMFFLVGVIYDRAHHRDLNRFRGLYEPMPLYGGISAIIFFGAMGLPGLCGFVGEFMVVLATWNYDKVFAILSALTVVLTAAYILWTLQRVYLGTNPAYKDYPDITFRELLCITPLIVLAVVLGILPMLVLQWMEPSVTGLVDSLAQLTRTPPMTP